MHKETIIYACKVGQPSYMEEVLFACKGYVNIGTATAKAMQWASDNGYDRVRVAVIDLSAPPNFSGAVAR